MTNPMMYSIRQYFPKIDSYFIVRKWEKTKFASSNVKKESCDVKMTKFSFFPRKIRRKSNFIKGGSFRYERFFLHFSSQNSGKNYSKSQKHCKRILEANIVAFFLFSSFFVVFFLFFVVSSFFLCPQGYYLNLWEALEIRSFRGSEAEKSLWSPKLQPSRGVLAMPKPW